ncbi:MAG: hypothetical protein MUF05_03685 [Candidatus Omnitrophica bacterium]|jgi:HAMP domain-containing protein|nr:hypothetical protein [Candidatus Omnitrophota bacterium]
MEQKHKRKKIWEISYAIKFLNVALGLMILLVASGFFFFSVAVKQAELSQARPFSLQILTPYVLLLAASIVASMTLLIVLYRCLAPLPRIEKILDQVLQGDYSKRIILRKKDMLEAIALRVNQLIERLEKNKK